MKNTKVRKQMEEIFGSECWIDKLDLKPRTIIGDFKGKSIKRLKKDKVLTYHHIIMRKDGGKPTIANGALISSENHDWLHQQKQWKQDAINGYFQQYKINFILANFDDEMAIKATKLQIDYSGLDDEDYFTIGYDPELDDLNDQMFKKIKQKKDEEERDEDR